MIYIIPGLIGGGVAGAILIAQHYKMNRAKLKRQHAYVAGVLGLNVGFLVFILVAGLPFQTIIGIVTVEAVAGGAVLVVYRKDELSDLGQLDEALNRADRAERELAEARAQIAELQKIVTSGPVKWEQLLEMFSPFLTAMDDLTRVEASMHATARIYYKLAEQANKEIPDKIRKMNAARAAKREAAQNDGGSR
jgi:hypothetical protein